MACQGFEPKGRGGLRTWCRGCGQHLDSHSASVAAVGVAEGVHLPPEPVSAAAVAAFPADALLAQKEASLIASYEHLYRQMVATSSSTALGFDALERAVAAHNGAVRCYDKEMTALNRARLAELAGGWGRLLRVGGGAAAACGGVRVSDLGEQVRAAHQSVGNNSSNPAKRGADRIFATATVGLVSAAEARELRRAIDLVGFRPFIRTLPDSTTGLSKREPRRTHMHSCCTTRLSRRGSGHAWSPWCATSSRRTTISAGGRIALIRASAACATARGRSLRRIRTTSTRTPPSRTGLS